MIVVRIPCRTVTGYFYLRLEAEMAMNASTQSCQQMAFSFHHISVRFSVAGEVHGPAGAAGPDQVESVPQNKRTSINPKAKSQESSKKSVYVRKEFPETWLWTEEMVK